MATTLILLLSWTSYEAGQLRRAIHRAVVTRSSFDIVATFLFLIALFNMPIGNVMAINMATPLAMTAAAAVLLKAPVGWRRWCAVLVGFGGKIGRASCRKEWVSTCRSRWSPSHSKKKTNKN